MFLSVCCVFQALYQINLLNCCCNLMLVCEDDCAVIGYQLFVVMVSVLGLSTQEFISNKALGIYDYHPSLSFYIMT
jgi:hypothetical protein